MKSGLFKGRNCRRNKLRERSRRCHSLWWTSQKYMLAVYGLSRRASSALTALPDSLCRTGFCWGSAMAVLPGAELVE